MQEGGLLTGTYQDESDVTISEIRHEAKLTSLMASIVLFFKCISSVLDAEDCHGSSHEFLQFSFLE